MLQKYIGPLGMAWGSMSNPIMSNGHNCQKLFRFVPECLKSGLTLQPSAMMADFELTLIQASYLVSDYYTVIRQIQKVYTYSLCNNPSRSTQNIKARRFNYSTVVLISGNENQERYSWYKT